MLRNKIYYGLKPLIPHPIRMEVRRRIAARTREHVSGVWPIMPGSERRPEGWPGWPNGKKFALVLTHDVEGRSGLEKVRRLADLEREMGFRSSFNFIPEGSYKAPAELREELVRDGFEVAVHDLNHDGRLYRSRREFTDKARKINGYLSEWGAVGFRSGFMLSNLDWHHELEIDYDMSTFDTDPFEPQPHGSHTIFPFWVPAPASQRSEVSGQRSEVRDQRSEIRNQKSDPSSDLRHSSAARPPWRGIRHSAGRAGGYVELPYTLPQDSTLFLLLREETPEIWIRKLDWIATHGGMALVNVHPDYCHFDNDRPSTRTFPVTRYRDFLQYVVERYRSEHWQPLPGQLAAFVRKLSPQPILRRAKRVCMVSHSFYESDNRVTRYAAALVARGDAVDVLALRQSPELPKQEIIEGVHVFRIQDRFEKAEQTKFAYLWPLLRFLKAATNWVRRRHAAGPYDLLHIHNVPDFMVFAGWYPKLRGARIILDIHDIVPEFFASKFGMMPKGLTFALLCWMERVSAAFADHVIIANDLWLTKYAVRTRTAGRCTVFINNVDSSVFTRRARQRNDGKLIVLFPGGLQWHQGVDIALRAFTEVRAELPHCEFHVYGDGNAKESLVRLAADLGLDGSVRFFKPRSVREIAAIMAEADLGVVPKRADSFGNEAYSTKIMEFMAVGVPVVVSSTKVDRYYFDDSVVRFFPSGNAQELAHQMLAVLRDAEMRREMVRRASEYAATHSWESRKADYLALVDSLCASDVALPTPVLAQKAA